MDNQRQQADRLRALHDPRAPLVLFNVWDVGSAKAVASTGVSAIATSSASMAWSLGAQDGVGTAAEGFFEMVARIAAAVAPLPLTVDIEAGFGTTPAQVATTVRKVVTAGAVGINLEDRRPAGAVGGPLFDIAEQQVRLRAARAAADALSVPLVINARTDVHLAGIGAPAERLELVVARAQAYRAAGADCTFVPGVRDTAAIGELVAGIEGPLNVMAVPGSPALPALAELGVARVSFGSWPAQAMLALVQRAAQSVLATGGYGALEGSLSYATCQSLITARVDAPAGAPVAMATGGESAPAISG